MDAAEFASLVEKTFRPVHGRRGFVRAAQEALGISRPQFHRYANGGAAVPERIADRLRALHKPPVPQFPSAAVMLALAATALVRLQRWREAPDTKEQPEAARSPYPRALRRLLDLLAAARMALPAAGGLPASLAELLDSTARPAALWLSPFGRLGPEDEDVRLHEHGVLTAEAFELARQSTIDAEEATAFKALLDVCQRRHGDGQQVYTTVRELVVRNPVLTDYLQDIVDDHPVLAFVPGARELLEQFYRPLSLGNTGTRRVAVCAHSGLPLTTRADGTYETECPDPEAVADARAGERRTMEVDAHALVLRQAFRVYWLMPGLTEIRLADRLRAAGYAVDLWPGLDTVDLEVQGKSLPRPLAIDVKDRASPRRLARDLGPGAPPGVEGTHRFAVAIPDYRDSAPTPYSQTFRTVRANLDLPAVEIFTVSGLLKELRA